jgi:hypothetical protein
VGGEIVSVERLPPGTNLEETFLSTVHHHRADGWIIENDPTYPCVFIHNATERRMLMISYSDPASTPLRHFSPWQS